MCETKHMRSEVNRGLWSVKLHVCRLSCTTAMGWPWERRCVGTCTFEIRRTQKAMYPSNKRVQAKLYDRNGLALGETMRGDMYIRDQKNTKGHVTGLTCGQWHPTDRNTVCFS
jgi:hypothetical protein